MFIFQKFTCKRVFASGKVQNLKMFKLKKNRFKIIKFFNCHIKSSNLKMFKLRKHSNLKNVQIRKCLYLKIFQILKMFRFKKNPKKGNKNIGKTDRTKKPEKKTRERTTKSDGKPKNPKRWAGPVQR
jgi:hypothetical protein